MAMINTAIWGSNEGQFRLLLEGVTVENSLALQRNELQWNELHVLVGNTEEKIQALEEKVKNLVGTFLKRTTQAEYTNNQQEICGAKALTETVKRQEELVESSFMTSIVLHNFKTLVSKSKNWKSQTFYTHERGYNICFGARAQNVRANGSPVLLLLMYAAPGEYDDELRWPVTCTFDVEIVNKRGENLCFRMDDNKWKRPSEAYVPLRRLNSESPQVYASVDCSELKECVENDSIEFIVRKGMFDGLKQPRSHTAAPRDYPISIDDHDPFSIGSTTTTIDPSIEVTHLYGPTVSLLMVYDKKSLAEQLNWKSLPFYTHPRGYKMRLGVRSDKKGRRKKKVILLDLYAVPGEYDKELKWPAHYSFQIEVVDNNNRGGKLVFPSGCNSWRCPVEGDCPLIFVNYEEGVVTAKHCTVKNFVKNGMLEFKVTSEPE